MKVKLVLKVLGRILIVEAVVMLLPIAVSLYYRENDWHAFLLPALSAAVVGLALSFLTRKTKPGIHAREGFVIVGTAWLSMSLIGALPFFISGEIPNYIDCVFETISGFTTAGSSILTNVEALSRGLLFWRSLTQWIGGMGVLILFLALLPSLGERSIQLMRAEAPGPTVTKIVPRIDASAKILYIIYFVLTLAMIIALVVAGMPVFDSVNHALATAGTGGFSIKNASIGYYNNPVINVIIATFMIIFGVNFSIYFYIIKRKFREASGNTELKAYIGIIVAAVVMIAIDVLASNPSPDPSIQGIGSALNHAYFQVASIITTTGFASTNFELWPTFSKMIIIFLMFVGASAGSTSGGIKVSRVVILVKASYRDLKKILHPRSVNTVRLDKKSVSEEVVSGVVVFFTMYMLVILVASLVISLDHKDLITTTTAVLACISNIGPGLGEVGPIGNFSEFSQLSKVTLSLCMLIGRLEILPILVLFLPASWKKN